MSNNKKTVFLFGAGASKEAGVLSSDEITEIFAGVIKEYLLKRVYKRLNEEETKKT